jgi:hypothetical protein
VTGAQGMVWVGPYRQATLVTWTYTHDADGRRVRGQAGDVDQFWATHPVTHVTLPVGREVWRLQVIGGDLATGFSVVTEPPKE